MTRRISIAVSAAIVAASATAAPKAEQGSEWGRLLALDAQVIADVIRKDHPGPYDRENPAFARLLQSSLDKALARSRFADDRDEYFWALREFISAFDDGHLSLSYAAFPPSTKKRQWPGFLTREIGGRQQVFVSRSADAPPLGAELVGCDGLGATDVAARNIGRFSIRWSLRGQREFGSIQLFVDSGNPYIKRPVRCAFSVAGKRRHYQLTWRPLPAEEYQAALAVLGKRASAGIGLRPVGDGFWIGASSFNSENAEDHQQLAALVEKVKGEAAGMRRSPFVVLDLRGNNGGSSFWPTAMAKALWGDAPVKAHEAAHTAIDWRASPGNIAHVESLLERFRKGSEKDLIDSYETILAGMKAAHASGQPFWRDHVDKGAAAATNQPQVLARTFVITDSNCASACLDAVDLWKALGARQVGRETSADTFYMEVKRFPLPSNFSWGVVPTKVWRGRKRGSNVPQRPDIPYEGDLNDLAALERLVQSSA